VTPASLDPERRATSRRSPAWLVRLTSSTEEGTAGGIYGVIVSSAVMAASHATTAIALVLAVLVTLLVYWSAERYARLMAQRIHEGHRPRRDQVREQVTTGWEMVTASALPLAVLILVRLVGGSLTAAVIAALVCSTVLLFLAGWEIGRYGHLSRLARLASAVIAATFGGVMIVLKVLLH
jgi:hypothetical protein